MNRKCALFLLFGFVTLLAAPDGVVWVRVQRLEAHPFDERDVAVVSKTKPSAIEPDSREASQYPVVAEVLELRKEDIVVGIGAEHGVEQGAHMEIFLRRLVDVGGEEQAAEEQVALVGVVTAVSPGRSVVKLGVNERIPAGALARPTSKPLTSNRLLPPRVGGIWELESNARPFLALGTTGFGTISGATVRRRFESTWSVEARFEPLSLGVADEGNVTAVACNVIGSYDTRLFSVGLGLGRLPLSQSQCRWRRALQ